MRHLSSRLTVVENLSLIVSLSIMTLLSTYSANTQGYLMDQLLQVHQLLLWTHRS